MILRSQRTPDTVFTSLPLTGRLFSTRRRKWISATNSYNFFMNDLINDWIKKHGSIPVNEQLFMKALSKQGNSFEEFVVRDLSNKIGKSIPTVSTIINSHTVKETIRLMTEGTPIIHSAPLRDTETKTQGIADLLVRSDCFHQFFKQSIPRTERYHANNLSHSFYYVVIDIKFRTFKLQTDKETPYKSPSIAAFRDQLFTYTSLVGKIQGYTPSFAFLLGRQYDYTINGVKYRDTCYDERLAKIIFTPETEEDNKSAREWLRKVSSSTVSLSSIYPNMSNTMSHYPDVKKRIARELGEITQIWQCGVPHRQRMLDIGVHSLYDPRCTATSLGFTGKRAECIQQIIDINHPSSTHLILPEKLSLVSYPNEFYIDFELIPESLRDTFDSKYCNRREHLFLIGIGWDEQGTWNYKGFVAKNKSSRAEKQLVTDVIAFLPPDATIYHWSHIERTSWNKISNRHHINTCNYNWVDMAKIFTDTPIAIKGCYNYKLKNISSAMQRHGMIESTWPKGIMNGVDCAAVAHILYETRDVDIHDSKEMDQIIRYNEVDCKVLWEIMSYLQSRV